VLFQGLTAPYKVQRSGFKACPETAPLGSRGELDDYVGPVLFLSSQWANFITGVDLPVEGGRMAAR
jgi:NAD(P)-dependent dehydrogenase (short-subunit alcohol dehydrogenase family)